MRALDFGALTPSLTLARFALLEAARSGLPWLVVGALGVGVGLSGFLSRLALVESVALQAGVLAAFFRLTVVFLTAALVVTSIVRESNDKVTELILSLPISRFSFYLGKLVGFSACGSIMAGIFSLTLLFWCAPLGVAAWCLSLILEVSLVVALSLFFVVTIGNIVPALAAVACTYFLSRVVASIQSISTSPLTGESTGLQRLANGGVDLVAALLPPLDRATRTEWLLYAPPSLGEFLQLAGLLLVYCALIFSAGMIDFHRRNL